MPVSDEMTVSVQNSADAHSRVVVKHVKVRLLLMVTNVRNTTSKAQLLRQ